MRLFRTSLPIQMAFATCFGIICGLFFGDSCQLLSPWAAAYVLLLKVTALPYLTCAIVHGIGLLNASQAKQIAVKGLLFIGIAFAINIGMIYLLRGAIPTPLTTQTSGYISNEAPSIDFAALLIPSNVFHALANNIIPAVVIFSILVGVALIGLKEKTYLMGCCENIVESLTQVTIWISRITPLGTFVIIANQAGTIQLDTIKQVGTYVVLYIACLVLLIFWIFPRIVHMLTSIPASRWIKQVFPIMLLAYTTNAVIVCVPYIIELLKKELQVLDPADDQTPTQISGTVAVVFNLPLAAIFITAFIFFVAIFYNVHLSSPTQIKLFFLASLTGLGSSGMGSWLNSLHFLLDSLGLPKEAVNLYLTTLPFTSGFQSILSVMELSCLSFFITLSCKDMILLNWRRLLGNSMITIFPLVLIFGGLCVWNPLPSVQNNLKSIYNLTIVSPHPATFNQAGDAIPFTGSTLERIQKTKTLRVGINMTVPPFCFYNNAQNIVGYDIAFAYELAHDLGCTLEFVPMHFDRLEEELINYEYDIAMSAVSITENRLQNLCFTKPYLTPRLALIVKEGQHKNFLSIDAIRDNEELQIATMRGSAYQWVAQNRFPAKKPYLIDNADDFLKCKDQYALLWEEEEGYAWLLLHRGYRLVFCSPELGKDSLGYAIRQDDTAFLNFLNSWIELKTVSGYTKNQYDLWIEGKTNMVQPKEPRWNILHNVLHWGDP